MTVEVVLSEIPGTGGRRWDVSTVTRSRAGLGSSVSTLAALDERDALTVAHLVYAVPPGPWEAGILGLVFRFEVPPTR